MMFCWNQSRQFVQNFQKCYSTAAKSGLATLRKETGFSIKNCKTALEMHSHDLKKAAAWLNEEAQKQGWERATKLQNRATTQGLVGIHVQNGSAALIEVCCETDFVSRNTIFRDFVKQVATATFDTKLSLATNQSLTKQKLSTSELTALPSGVKYLGDQTALAIAQLGENIILRRGLRLLADDDVVLSASVHPAPPATDETLVGSYGAVIALKVTSGQSKSAKGIEDVGRKLCMHIIGMKPKFIKSDKQRIPLETKVSDKHLSSSAEEHEEESEFSPEAPEEDALLDQAFVFEPELTVRDFLLQQGLEVVHFERFERGEMLECNHS